MVIVNTGDRKQVCGGQEDIQKQNYWYMFVCTYNGPERKRERERKRKRERDI